MATGIVTIIAWNQWIEPKTEIDGAFVAMLANGLAMLAAHYLLPQPPGTGWASQMIHLSRLGKLIHRKKNVWPSNILGSKVLDHLGLVAAMKISNRAQGLSNEILY
jgi:hypothetical protein